MNENCKHEWVVFSTCLGTVEIMCECVTCGAFGVVSDSTRQEWNEAFHAPSHPNRWQGGDDRVVIKKIGSGEPHYVMKGETT